MLLKGKYALITGSSRGIGRGIALKLAEQGVKVAINYCRNEAAANDALSKVRGLGSDGFIVQADVCRPDDVSRMFARAKQEFGALDIFVANARPEVPTFYQPPLEITLESWQTAAGWITGQLIAVDGGAGLMDAALPLEIQQAVPPSAKTN